MKSEVAPIADARQHCVGDSADADLNGRAVVDIATDMARDRLFDHAQRLCPDLDGRARGANDKVDTRQIHPTLAPGPRHLIVDLGDDHAGMFHRSLLEIVTDREAVFTVLAGFAELHEDDVGRENTLLEIFRNFRQMTWHDPQQAFAGEAAQTADSAKAAEGERVGMFALESTARADAAKKHARVADSMTLLEQLVNHGSWFASALAPDYMVAVTDDGGEIERLAIDFVRHRRCVRLEFLAKSRNYGAINGVRKHKEAKVTGLLA
jgi:hypothetical protein